ncbi:hypothetical protein VTN31DRAFT_5053 [Thermomyces dupontii]|uniref:uncharacterized protein n=1 Tax=Talaromyces thermophilus TaxID=28565 RepID=UPI00374278B3
MIFVNGQFPGPPLILNEGDDVTVYVNNYLPFNTTVHFHGIEQLNTAWSDGVPGLTQWAIQPGESFKYQWHANTYGTYWYHAHAMATIQDGLYGPIYIRPGPRTSKPFELITSDRRELRAIERAVRNPEPIMLSDWTNFTSFEYMNALEETGYDIFCVDSILVQGKGSVYCKEQSELNALIPPPVKQIVADTVTDKGCLLFVTATQGNWEHHPEKLPPGLNDGCVPSEGPEEVFYVDPNRRWASLNFISGASLKALVVSVDEHPMWVYEVDGRYIEPQLAHSIEMYNGERYSVLIKLDREPGDYRIRIANTGGNQIISGFATLSYKRDNRATPRESVPYINYGGQNVSADVIPLNLSNLPPYPPVYPAEKADAFHLLTLRRINSSWEWSLDGTQFLPNDLSAIEPILYNPNTSDIAPALKIATKNNTWVDIVFQLDVGDPSVTPVQPPHPMHKHSNKMFLIGSGQGQFNWSSIDEAIAASPQNFFLDRPLYRDTFVTSPRGVWWTAIRYHVENPGPFMLHCHMETHLFSGMGLVLLDGIDVWEDIVHDSWECGSW